MKMVSMKLVALVFVVLCISEEFSVASSGRCPAVRGRRKRYAYYREECKCNDQCSSGQICCPAPVAPTKLCMTPVSYPCPAFSSTAKFCGRPCCLDSDCDAGWFCCKAGACGHICLKLA